MKKLFVLISLFLTLSLPVFACDSDALMSPDPGYLNTDAVYTASGTVTGATSIGWMYGYQSNEHDFSVNIPGWTCSNGQCSGSSYTGAFTASIYVNPTTNWIGRLTVNGGQCPMGYQTAINNPGLTYQMDQNVATSATGFLGSLVSVVLTRIPLAIAIVGGLIVTLYGLRKLIYWVRRFI